MKLFLPEINYKNNVMGILMLVAVAIPFARFFRQTVLAYEEEILATPYIGIVYNFIAGPNTYYRADTAAMFGASVKAAIEEVLDQLRNEQGLKALSPDERKPRLRDL